MSKAGALVWLLVALVLGGAAIWLLRKPPAEAPSARIAVIDAPLSRIVGLTVTPAGSPARHVRRDAVSGEWSLHGPGGQWPVQIGNIQGALRLLAALEGRPSDAPGPGAGDAEVLMALDDGSEWTIWLAERALGGERLARIQPPTGPGLTALVDAALFDALITTGPEAWRIPLALSEPMTDVTGITLSTVKGRIVLGRVSGRWGLREPIAARADDRAVQALFKSLSAVRVTRFLDHQPDETAAQLEIPLATATLETDRRVPRGDGFATVTGMTTLTVGGPATIDGKELYARIDRRTEDAETSAWFTVGRESVEGMSMDPSLYIAPAAIAAPTGEVGLVEVSAETGSAGRRFARTIDGWEGVPTPAEGAGPVDLLLQLLCTQAPESIRLSQPDGEPAHAVATVGLYSLGDTPLGTVALALSPDATKVHIRTGEVTRIYDAASLGPVLDWLQATVAPDGVQPPPTEDP
jgi:hypothetical protein